MSGINKVILVGRLGKEPDVRYTQDGEAIANITLATSESWKDKNTGQKNEKTEWHRVVFFGGIAGIVGEYLHKGSNIYLEGKMQTRKWQDKEGQDKYTTEVVVSGFKGVMQMLDNANQPPQQNQNNAPQQNQQPAQTQSQVVDNMAAGFDEFEDGTPF